MIESLLAYSDLGPFVLRVGLAAIFIYHAFPKLAKPGMMGQGMGWSASKVFVLGLVEFLSSLALLTGLWAQYGALALAIVMAGAIFYKVQRWHMPFSSQQASGWEFDLILLAASVAILLMGSGEISLSLYPGVENFEFENIEFGKPVY